MQQTVRVIKVGASLYFKVPVGFRQMYDVEPGDYFIWKYEDEGSAYVTLLTPAEPCQSAH
jgi:hypothetical protein